MAISCYQSINNDSGNHRGHDFINADTIPIVTLEELNQHATSTDCWVAIHGHVYDITDFLQAHPGGEARLMRFAGKDATKGFRLQHPEGYLERYLGAENYKGEFLLPKKEKKNKKEQEKSLENKKGLKQELGVSFEDSKDEDVYQYYKKVVDQYLEKKKSNKEKSVKKTTTEVKPSLNQIFSLNDFEYVAKKVLPELVYTYIQSGSDNEVSRYEDRAALCRIFFRPRCLVDVSELDLSNEFLGLKVTSPFIVGSFTGSGLIQNSAESLVMKCASKAGVPYIIPKNSDSPLSEVMESSLGTENFYQYSIDSATEMKTCAKDLNNLVESYPNIKAVFIDVTGTIPTNIEHYRKVEAARHLLQDNPAPQIKVKERVKCEMSWDDLVRIKSEVKVPIILKGVLRPEDVLKSQQLGFKGVMISGHDGKHIDQYQSPIEVLYNVHKTIGDNTEDFSVFVESDFRRGSDIVKTLCLNGIPVLGKAILFSEVYGEEGVDKSIETLKNEISTTMKLIGVKSVRDLNAEYVDTESLNFKVSGSRSLDAMYDSNYTKLPPPAFLNQEKLKML